MKVSSMRSITGTAAECHPTGPADGRASGTLPVRRKHAGGTDASGGERARPDGLVRPRDRGRRPRPVRTHRRRVRARGAQWRGQVHDAARARRCAPPPTSGTAEIAGVDLARDPTAAKQRTGYCPDVGGLIPRATPLGAPPPWRLACAGSRPVGRLAPAPARPFRPHQLGRSHHRWLLARHEPTHVSCARRLPRP